MNKKQIQREIETITHITFDLEDRLRKLTERLINSESKKETIEKKHPLQSIGETNDISNTISFLISNKSKWITGQIIRVDGGLSNIR